MWRSYEMRFSGWTQRSSRSVQQEGRPIENRLYGNMEHTFAVRSGYGSASGFTFLSECSGTACL